MGVPGTFKEYVELLFDLQALAFQADITRVGTLMMARENTGRAYPEIGVRRCASLDLASRQQPREARGVMRRSTRITSRC